MISKAFIDKEPIGVAAELVKNYRVELLNNDKIVASRLIENNHQRLNIIDFKPEIIDEVRLIILSTNGDSNARVFEVRIY